MWADPNLNELKERISKMSDEELLQMVGEDFEDYRQEALQFAEAELAARGIQLEDREKEVPRGFPRNEAPFVPPGRNRNPNTPFDMQCNLCGGLMRSGFLHAKFEITISFTDKNEERFIDVLACSRCGQVRLRVDYQTDVEY
jgi:hypothetical protein